MRNAIVNLIGRFKEFVPLRMSASAVYRKVFHELAEEQKR